MAFFRRRLNKFCYCSGPIILCLLVLMLSSKLFFTTWTLDYAVSMLNEGNLFVDTHGPPHLDKLKPVDDKSPVQILENSMLVDDKSTVQFLENSMHMDDKSPVQFSENSVLVEASNNLTFVLKAAAKILPLHKLGKWWMSNRHKPNTLRSFFQKNKEKLSGADYEPLMNLLDGFKKRLPGAVIIGCKKCGTTFLLTLLHIHPYIATSMRETMFFHKTKKSDRTAERYRKAMLNSFPDQLTMEKSAPYWRLPDTPSELHEIVPDVKIILLVRDPACRIVSDYYHHVRTGALRKNITLQDVLTDPQHSGVKSIIMAHSQYDLNMKRWLARFPMSQILIIRNEDLTTDKFEDIVVDTEAFLNLPQWYQIFKEKKKKCVKNDLLDYKVCSPIREVPSNCSYENQYKTELKYLRNELKSNVVEFEKLVNRHFQWF